MAFTFKIKKNSPDSHQMAAYWLAVIIPFKYRDTFNRGNESNPRSFDNIDNPVEEAETLIIDNDIFQFQTSESKGNHISGMEFALKETSLRYTSRIAAR